MLWEDKVKDEDDSGKILNTIHDARVAVSAYPSVKITDASRLLRLIVKRTGSPTDRLSWERKLKEVQLKNGDGSRQLRLFSSVCVSHDWDKVEPQTQVEVSANRT